MEKNPKDQKPGASNEKKDYSTAILDRKKAPNRLMVEEGIGQSDDNR